MAKRELTFETTGRRTPWFDYNGETTSQLIPKIECWKLEEHYSKPSLPEEEN
ncbi:hypothetical protein WA026_005605, partial [Henosepilachna vigintioctopunctata]